MPRALLSAVVATAVLAAGCASLTPDELADTYRQPDLRNLGLAPTSTTEPADAGALDGSAATDVDDTSAADEPDLDQGRSSDGRAPRANPLIADPTECWFDTTGYSVECGWIHIPSETPGVDATRLSFARFEASASDVHDDPVFYLHGGPGGSVLEVADLLAPSVVDPFVDSRDVVLYDQRGGGESSPLPLCREAWGLDMRFFASDEPHADIEGAYLNSLARCAERIERRDDIALDEYNSAVNADDLLDLIRALGYETVNLYGNSYGTRLAQTMIRDHPEVVRAMILSGVYPIEENLVGTVPEAFRSSLEGVFTACTTDPVCGEHLPDPWASLTETVARLDETPIEFDVATGEVAAFPLDFAGDDLVNLLHGLLYTADGAALIPDLLIDLEHDHTTRLRRLAPDVIFDTAGILGFATVECREEAPFTTPEQLAEAERTDTPWHRVSLAPGLIGPVLLEVCDLFPSIGAAEPIENEPVTWTQPTLLLSGGIDPITPPWWAEAMAARLPNTTLAAFADRGHDADEGPCAVALMQRFLDEPDQPLDVSCAADYDGPYVTQAPELLVSPSDGALEPSSFDIDPSSGTDLVDMMLPGWYVDLYATENAYWRNLDYWDPTVVVVRAGAWEPDEVLWYVDGDPSAGFDTSSGPDNLSGRWERLVFDGPGLDAVSYVIDEAGFSLNISIVAPGFEIGVLERTILQPIVASVRLP